MRINGLYTYLIIIIIPLGNELDLYGRATVQYSTVVVPWVSGICYQEMVYVNPVFQRRFQISWLTLCHCVSATLPRCHKGSHLIPTILSDRNIVFDDHLARIPGFSMPSFFSPGAYAFSEPCAQRFDEIMSCSDLRKNPSCS